MNEKVQHIFAQDMLKTKIFLVKEVIDAGKLVVFPTDTLYGIAAAANNRDAVAALLKAKGRSRDMPVAVLVADLDQLKNLVADFPAAARVLADKFLPGALMLILPAKADNGFDLGNTNSTIAVRIPDHDCARRILAATGPLAVSSANISGQPPARTCAAAREMLGDAVALYVDGGEVSGGVASTIVDFASSAVGNVVRLGAISLAQLHEVAPLVQLSSAGAVS